LFIEASQRLDREQQDSYNMTLLASDHGSPPRTGSIQVQVRVTDVNDNSPEFVKSLFSPKLPILETAPVNSVVLTLAAADKDSGSYGQVIFDFAPELSVGGAERRQQQRLARLQFQVIARDNSKEVNDRRTSTATVSVSISDHNDEPPSVEVCSPTGRCPGVGSVKEGQPVGARVAMVIVRDPDTNDRVSCAVNDGSGGTAASSFFELVSKTGSSEPRMEGSVNVWTYYLATKLRLDREQTPKLCFRILCSDSAGLSSTAHGHCVDISDINDNPPILLRAIQLNAMEEDSSLRPIGRLTDFLTDADEGVNAKLNFSLDAAATEPEAGATFSVDAVSGLVTPLRTLDRERRSEYLLKVRVSDNGEPARSVTVDVAIAVLDINDHAPEFESCSSIQLRLLENRPPPALVGRLTARDADWSNNGNGRVQYRLEKSAESSAFDIDRQTGEIRAVAALDRELRSHYSFRVLAEDQPQQRGLQLTGTCHVTITVDDVNDNAPSLRIDPPEFPAEFVVNQLEPGHRIGHVVADDPDEGINQKVVYELLNSSDQRFGVHSDTGSILVSQPLHNIRQLPGQSTHSIKLPLSIRACDLGQPRMCSQPVEYRAEIPAQTAADAAFRGGDSSLTNGRSPHNVNNYGNGSLLAFSNESVIICLVVTLLLLVAACFAIVCLIVRRRASAAALNSRTAAAAGAAGAACGTGTLQAGRLATEVDPDSVHAKMIDQQSPYYCPPTYKTNFNVEDDYGAYSSAQQLQHQQQMLQLNKLKHATSHTLPRGGFSVDGKSAGFPLQQTQQQQLHAMQQRAPFSPYTEASFV
uniref:CA domain-containing protein n=1 Tax=Macrostomum lignano TaxID=282301 RepID=A0A1I8J669_9PLAT